MDDAALQSLPDDPGLLKQLLLERHQHVAQLLAQRDAHLAERDHRIAELELDKLRLQHQLMQALKKLYGPRGDRLVSEADVAQLLLEFATALEALPVELADLPAEVDSSGLDSATIDPATIRRVKRRGRRDLGSDEFDPLPLIRKEHDLKETDKPCPCCHQARVKIGEESSWQIEYIPGYFQRIEHVRLK